MHFVSVGLCLLLGPLVPQEMGLEEAVSRGHYAKADKNCQAAVDAWTVALAIEPTRHDLHQEVADCFLSLKDYAAAVRHFEEALRLKPSDAAARAGLAEARSRDVRFAANSGSPRARGSRGAPTNVGPTAPPKAGGEPPPTVPTYTIIGKPYTPEERERIAREEEARAMLRALQLQREAERKAAREQQAGGLADVNPVLPMPWLRAQGLCPSCGPDAPPEPRYVGLGRWESFDAGSGNRYVITRRADGTVRLEGSNLKTASFWHTEYFPDGRMRGVDKDFNFWTYDPRNCHYFSTDGTMCFGCGPLRTCMP